MYPSVIYKNCRRGKEAFGAWQHRTVDLSDLFKLEPYLGFLKLHCGLVACFLVLGFVKVKINGLEYYQALCVYLDTESVSSFWETQYSRLFKIQSLIGLLRSSTIVPVSLHRLVMNRMIVVKYGVGEWEGLAYACSNSPSTNQDRRDTPDCWRISASEEKSARTTLGLWYNKQEINRLSSTSASTSTSLQPSPSPLPSSSGHSKCCQFVCVVSCHTLL